MSKAIGRDVDRLIDRFESEIDQRGFASVSVREFLARWEREESRLEAAAITELLRVWCEHRFACEGEVNLLDALKQVPGYQLPPECVELLELEIRRLHLAHDTNESSRAAGLNLPEPGSAWGEFRLVAELGRGAFARVYLARQSTMADRVVALKLTRRETRESDLLARLHHAAIVPIYSIHHHDGIYGVCMPFLGNTTLADVMVSGSTDRRRSLPASDGKTLLRRLAERQSRITTIVCVNQAAIDTQTDASDSITAPVTDTVQRSPTARAVARLSRVEWALWIAAELADALAHAHRHGVLHCDIKPANILISADGQPRLLDFNVSLQRQRAGGEPGGYHSPIGGTLAYMSPEQYRALQDDSRELTIDGRSDIYSLGVVLYELLTGKLPPEAGPGASRQVGASNAAVMERSSARQLERHMRAANPGVTPAVARIVSRCLQRDAALRYPTADALYEDLQAQLQHRPLCHQPEPSVLERLAKWRRRHPVMASNLTLLIIGALLSIGVAAAWIARGRALAAAQMRQGLLAAHQKIPEAIAWLTAAEVDPELAANAQDTLEGCWRELPDQQSQTRAGIQALIAQDPSARLPAEVYHDVERLLGFIQHHDMKEAGLQGAAQQAQRLLEALADFGPADSFGQPPDRVPTGSVDHQRVYNQLDRAYLDSDYRRVVELAQELPLQSLRDYATWLIVGHSQMKLRRYRAAQQSYTHCIALRPELPVGWFYRGIAKLQERRFQEAAEDFRQTLRLSPQLRSAKFNLALALRGAGQPAEALRLVNELISAGWHSVAVHALAGRLLMAARRPDEAKREFQEALRGTPKTALDWIQRGMLMLNADPQAAAKALEMALEFEPDSVPALQNLAHIYAERLDRPDDAMPYLDRLVALVPDDPSRWAGRAVVQGRLGRWQSALSDANRAARLPVDQPIVAYQIACAYSLVGQTLTNSTAGDAQADAEPENEEGAGPDETRQPEQIMQAAERWYQMALRQQPSLLKIARTDPDIQWLLQSSPNIKQLHGAIEVLDDTSDASNPAYTTGSW